MNETNENFKMAMVPTTTRGVNVSKFTLSIASNARIFSFLIKKAKRKKLASSNILLSE